MTNGHGLILTGVADIRAVLTRGSPLGPSFGPSGCPEKFDGRGSRGRTV